MDVGPGSRVRFRPISPVFFPIVNKKHEHDTRARIEFSFECGHLLRNGNKCLPFHLSDDLPRALLSSIAIRPLWYIQLQKYLTNFFEIGRRFAERANATRLCVPKRRSGKLS